MTGSSTRSLIGKGIEGFMLFVTMYIFGFCAVITMAWGAISLLSWVIFG
jgi:L-cysteine desulfidase